MLFAFAAALLCGVLFGIAPALRTEVRDLEQSLRAGARSIIAGSRRLHAAFVVTEIALAVVLLVSAGMLGRTLLREPAASREYVLRDVRPTFIHTADIWAKATAFEEDPRFAVDYAPIHAYTPLEDPASDGHAAGLFVRRDALQRAGGIPDQPLMEDIELSKRLRKLSRPACLYQRVSTSGRRWERDGVWRTVVLMWRLRLLYWIGMRPERLARMYR